MTASSPLTETVQFITKLLDFRPMPVSELVETIITVKAAFGRLEGGDQPIQTALPVPPPPRARQARPKPLIIVEADEAAPDALVTEVAPVIRRPRGRPRKVVAPVAPPTESLADEPEAAAQPRLLRRADVTAVEHQEQAPPHPVVRAPGGVVRGVVKWFDGRTGKGVLRLTGISGDVSLEAAVLEQSGVKRLYKDQEIEATVQDLGGRVRLVSLSLPGRGNDRSSSALANEVLGSVRRQPRQVMVEIKRDGVRQRSARAEAEQVLGGVGRAKITRRLTP